MSISVEEVKKLAELSRIQLSDEELVSMQTEISSILGYVEQINNVSFEGSDEQSADKKNVWREDVVTNESEKYTEKLLVNAPNRDGNYVKVKNIL